MSTKEKWLVAAVSLRFWCVVGVVVAALSMAEMLPWPV